MTDPDEVLDDPDVAGLAGERTDLAWSRTALAATVAVLAILRQVWQEVDIDDGRVVVASIIGVGTLVSALALWWSDVAARPTMEGQRFADQRRLRRVSVGTTLFSVAALLLALLPGGR